MAISFNGNTLTGVAIGDTPVNAVYCNESLVFDSWDTFSFPNGNDKMSNNNNEYCGFKATGSSSLIYNSTYYHHYKSFNNNGDDCYTAEKSDTPYLFLKFPTEFEDSAIITSIKVTGANNPGTAVSDYAQGGKIYLIKFGSDPKQQREEYSDFKIDSTPKTFSPKSAAINIQCGGVVFTSEKSTRAKYGNITINFKLPWSKLNAWKQQYNIS